MSKTLTMKVTREDDEHGEDIEVNVEYERDAYGITLGKATDAAGEWVFLNYAEKERAFDLIANEDANE